MKTKLILKKLRVVELTDYRLIRGGGDFYTDDVPTVSVNCNEEDGSKTCQSTHTTILPPASDI